MPITPAVLMDNGLRNYLRRVPSNSVLYYPGLDYGNWHTSTIKDYSGYANNGTITGATTQILPSGLAILRYDGNDLITIDSALTQLAATTKGTWMTWIKLDDATPAASTTIIMFGDTNADEYIELWISTAGILRCYIRVAGVAKWYLNTDAQALSDGVYAHVALIQDGTSPVLLVNGIQVAQTFSVSTDKTVWFSGCAGIDNGRIGCGNYNSGGNTRFITNGNTTLTKLINTNLTVAQVLGIVQQERRFVGV